MNFTCPYCQMPQVATEKKRTRVAFPLQIEGGSRGPMGIAFVALGCSNVDCLEVTVNADVVPWIRSTLGVYPDPNATPFVHQRLLPKGAAKVLPNYIPAPLREDYLEACLIRDLSPKAAATLIRRCLQGMIRDFCGISDKTLNREISRLKTAVEAGQGPRGVSVESVDAIDHMREIGNVGAHMERDINLVIPVDASEVQILIELVESLLQEWYIERHNRDARFSAVREMVERQQIARSADMAAFPAPD